MGQGRLNRVAWTPSSAARLASEVTSADLFLVARPRVTSHTDRARASAFRLLASEFYYLSSLYRTSLTTFARHGHLRS